MQVAKWGNSMVSSDADETTFNDGDLAEAAQAFAAILKRGCR